MKCFLMTHSREHKGIHLMASANINIRKPPSTYISQSLSMGKINLSNIVHHTQRAED